MFKLIDYEIGPFRSYLEPQYIQFPENGLFLIEGKNLDTNGNSGSGKSNFFLGIEYAYGSCPFPSTVLGSWFSEEPPTSKVTFRTKDKLIKLERSKGLKIFENGIELEKSAAQKEEYLLKEIGISHDVRQALTYRAQIDPDSFLKKNNSEKSEFLTPLLDLIRFIDANEIGDQKVKELIEATEALKSSISTLVSTRDSISVGDIDQLQNNSITLVSRLNEINRKIQETKENQDNSRIKNESEALVAKEYYWKTHFYSEEKTKLEDLLNSKLIFETDETELNKLVSNISECETRLQKLSSEDNNRLNQDKKEFNEITKEVRVFQIELDKYDNKLAEKELINKNIAILKENKCPTCSQQWVKNQEKLNELNKKLEETNLFIDRIPGISEQVSILTQKSIAIQNRNQPSPNIDKFQKIINELNVKKATEQQRLKSAKEVFNANFNKEVAVLKNSIKTIETEAQDQYLNIKSKFSNQINVIYVSDIKDLENQADVLRTQINELKIQISKQETLIAQRAKLDKQISEKEQELNSITEKLNEENDLSGLIGKDGFLGSIFDESLEQISAETNDTLSKIPNTSHISIEFKSEKLTKKNTIKKEIIPVVTIGGFTAPWKSALSGGQLSVVQLAVDLAVARVISQRTGVVPGYLILDEPFQGLDTVSKESCFQLLQMYSQDRLIMVVDHDSEFKSLFGKIITIQFKGGVSKIIEDPTIT